MFYLLSVLSALQAACSQVDEEDLPANMESMEREELQCVAAAYNIDFDDKGDVKLDLVSHPFGPLSCHLVSIRLHRLFSR